MRQLLMHRPNLDSLPELPPLPDGLHLRVAAHADADTLASLLAAAFCDDTWTVERVGTSLHDAHDVPTTYAVFEGRIAIATASVLLREDIRLHSGYLHWVAVHPDWQGHRQGRLVSLAVLHEFARMKRREVFLKTDDQRLAAIKTYVGLGFMGVVRDDEERLRWANLSDLIPGLATEEFGP